MTNIVDEPGLPGNQTAPEPTTFGYMKAAKRWLVWERRLQPGKKDLKVPFYPDGTPRGTTDTPEDWARLGTYAEACQAYKQDKGRYAGIGFALGPDGTGWYWQGIDLDNIPENQLADLANKLPGYVEVSPSGNGAHAIGYGARFDALGSNGSGIEAYSEGRFFTFTDNMIRDGALVDLAPCVAQWLVPRHGRPPQGAGAENSAGSVQVDPQVIAHLRSALLHMRADDRDLWVRVGHALKELGDTGRGLWLAWSATSEKFDPADAARKWDSFKPNKTGHQAVFAAAQDTGWLNPNSNAARGITSAATAPQDWPEPEPLIGGLPPVPAFDPALLPDAFRSWVVDISDRMQCPLDFPAVAAIVTAASVVGRQCAIRPKRHDDWTVILNLWGAVIGRPGVLKTPAIQEPIRMLVPLESSAREEFERAVAEHTASEMVARAGLKETERRLAAAMKRGDTAEAGRIALAAVRAEAVPPVRRRYMTSDTTVEKLGELLNENPRGILQFRDELVGLLIGLDREGREGSRQFYLEAWNGDGRFTFDRIGRGTIEIEAACISVLGGIQPGPLAEYLRSATRGGAGDDGLVQHLQLLVWPDVHPDFVNVDRVPDSPARELARQVYQRLDCLSGAFVGPAGAQTGTGSEVPYLRFADDAQGLFDEWRIALEARLRSGALVPAMESHLAKYRSLAPSLALLFHLMDGGLTPVSRSALERALAWCVYLEQHAHRVYSTAVAPEIPAARELAKHLTRGDLKDGFTAREVYLKGWRGLDVDTTPKALAVLADAGWVRERPIATGGRPKTEYQINPKVLK